MPMRQTGRQPKILALLVLIMISRTGALAQDNLDLAGDGTITSKRQESNRVIIVSIVDRKLALVEAGRVVKIYATAVGAVASPSPSGIFTITSRIPHPTYYTPGEVIPPGKANPLGTRWLGLSLKGFGIHGTNRPRSIGRAASHGCIRMRNGDVEELFELVRVGDAVELHADRTDYVAQIFDFPETALTQAALVSGPAVSGQ